MSKKSKDTIIDSFRRCRLTTVAGAWVFFFLFSLVPITFLLLSAFNLLGVDVSFGLLSNLPPEFREAGQLIIDTARQASRGVTVFFVITVIISCTNLLNQMSKDGDYIYDARSTKKKGFFRRLWAVVALLIMFVAFLLLAVIIAFGGALFSRVVSVGSEGIFAIISCVVITLFGYIIIILLNRFISPVKLSFFDVAIGSLISLAVIMIGTGGFTLFLRTFSYFNSFYGSLTAVIVFLTWAYIMMIGLVSGVIVNMHFHGREKRSQKKLVKAKLIKQNT